MSPEIVHLARLALVAFLLTFITVRNMVYLMSRGSLRNVFVHVKGTHIHHLNIGIFVLAGVGGYMLFWQPSGLGLDLSALVYGFGMALTFDEFGMWLHLEDNYWQRASWDAVGVIAAVLGLIAFAPSIYAFRIHHWLLTGIMAVALAGFFYFLFRSIRERREGKALL